MPAQTLRPYQLEGIAKIFDAFKHGARSVLCISPTGSGKTSIFSSIVSDLASNGVPSLINVHRRELASQACNRLREFGTDYGLIMSGEPRKPSALVQVASVQTLVRRAVPPARLVVNDEAHLSTANTWQTILEQYPTARILGFTATPFRLSGKPLVGQYDASVVVATPNELRQQGFLCPYNGFSYLTPDLEDVRTTGGDYNEHDSAIAMSNGLIVDNIVSQWLKHASHLSTVVFAVTVEHSKTLCAKFKEAGVTAEHLDGKTTHFQRDAILRRVDSGETMVLCNVGVAVEGLDIPRLKCCVLARPTKSLARAIQMMGRVRRPWKGVTARIHDHAFCIRAFGLPDADRDYSLSAVLEKPPALRTCSECWALYSGNACPACGDEQKPEAGERELNTVEDAEQYEFSSDVAPHPDLPEAWQPKPPVEIRWDKPGRVVEGQLIKKWDEDASYGPVRKYLVRGEKRDYVFTGTTQLNELLARVQIPDTVIRVTYTGDRDLGRSRVKKLFRVELNDGK